MDDMRCCRKCQTRACCLWSQNKDIEALIMFQMRLEAVHDVLPFVDRRRSIDKVYVPQTC